ncbi:hypothetical protein ABZ626_22740 [Streptomyces longispororuber]
MDGSTPEELLNDPHTVRIAGDATAGVFRRVADANQERARDTEDGELVSEAYVWSNCAPGNGSHALWFLLLPFMLINLAHWMRPTSDRRTSTVRVYGLLIRLLGLTLTVLLVAAACELAIDVTAWQCAGTPECAAERSWLGFLAPDASGHGGWWSQPGRRLALAALVPAALAGLLWYLSQRTWSAYESQTPLPAQAGPEEDPGRIALGQPGFWYGRRLGARLRAAHTAVSLFTVAAAVGITTARHDRRAGGPVPLEVFGWLLESALVAGGAVVVWVVCRRGRSESTLDRNLDRSLVRWLPLSALVLLFLALLYAGWSRPEWQSAGRLPGGDEVFGGIALVQGLLVIALALVARALYRTTPDPRTAIRGFGGPTVAMLSCALGGVMSAGGAQRIADWLDGSGEPGSGGTIDGPPVLLMWQASVMLPLLVIAAVLGGYLALRTAHHKRREMTTVLLDYPGEPEDSARTRRIAGARARAALTDQAPFLLGTTSCAALLLGVGALIGARMTEEVPGSAAQGLPPFFAGAAHTSQALGSWLIGFGLMLFAAWGGRAYRDPSARRTIGMLWAVGTFWPHAAHPFAPPCYAERAVTDLSWRIHAWTRSTGGRLLLSGHSQGSVLVAAVAWQLRPSVRRRAALLTYGSPLERLYGRWFPAYFGPAALTSLHRGVDHWRNLHRVTDPIGGPIRLPGPTGSLVDHDVLKDPLAYGRTEEHPLPAPLQGHSNYRSDPVFYQERALLMARSARKLSPSPHMEAQREGGAALDQPADRQEGA